MFKNIEEIKKKESNVKVVKNIFDKNEINQLLKIYDELPVEVFNKRQNIIKKKWSEKKEKFFQKVYLEKIKEIVGDFEMDNPDTKDGFKSLGLFQESFSPVSLHVDTGYDFNKLIYKQTLLPLTSSGETVIFKNRFYGCSTTFTIDENELKVKAFNKRSSEHLELYDKKDFDSNIHKKYLQHENIQNLKGLEIQMVYKWEVGDILIFDRTNLHCSSSNFKDKKIGLTSSTIKKKL